MRRVTLFGASLLLVSLFAASLLAVPHAFAGVDILRNGDNSNPSVCNNPNAAGTPSICADAMPNAGNPLVGPNGIITTYIKFLTFAVGLIAVVMIIVAGIRYITANGNAQSVATAQKTLIYALIALGVAALAQVIVTYVLSRLT